MVVEGRISAGGGEIILKSSPAASAALERWTTKFAGEVAAGDASGLAALLHVHASALEYLKQAGAIFSVTPNREPVGVIHIAAKDEASRVAIHQFIRSACGKVTVDGGAEHPGNNLGWDAPRDTQIDK